MVKSINFDMDGTIANLYGVEGWLDKLENEDATPYRDAKVMHNMSKLAVYLNKAQARGIEINIITWLSKGATTNYNIKVAQAKREWLNKHLPSVKFNNIYIIPYGVPKSTCIKGEGIHLLFDDEIGNINEWHNAHIGYAFTPDNLFGNLPKLF